MARSNALLVFTMAASAGIVAVQQPDASARSTSTPTPMELAENSAVVAVAAYALANSEKPLPR